MSATLGPATSRATSSSKRALAAKVAAPKRAKESSSKRLKRAASRSGNSARLKPSRKQLGSRHESVLVAAPAASSATSSTKPAVTERIPVAKVVNPPAIRSRLVPPSATAAPPTSPSAEVAKDRRRGKLLSDWGLAGLEAVDWPRLTPAGTGDHQAIYQFLLAAFQSPPYEQFLSALDEPLYEPSDRLLVKRGDQVLGHLRLARRVMQFGPLELPVAEVVGLAVLPEYRGLGFGCTLLGAVDRALAEDGTLLATLRTGIPQFFGRAGWSVCGRHSWSRANAREVLAQFLPHADSDQPSRYIIRPWRQVEMPALVRLYREQILRGAGAWQRTEATWRWLLGAQHSDQLFVAIDGPDQLELDDANAPIVGYLVLRDDAIIELVTSPDHPQAARELLIRACGEGIERNHHQAITLHAPPDHMAHDWFERVGGVRQHRETDAGRVGMAKLLDPVRFLETLLPLLHERAEAAQLDRPTELGLQVGRDKYRLIASRRSVKLGPPQLGRSYLTLGRGDFTRLLLGHLNIDEAVENGLVSASTRTAREAARALFPQMPLWRSPLDEPVC